MIDYFYGKSWLVITFIPLGNPTFCFEIIYLLKFMTWFVASAKEWWRRNEWQLLSFLIGRPDERMSLWIEWDGSHFLCEFIFSIERGVVGEDHLPKKSWPFEYKKWSKIYGWTDVKVFSCRFDRKQVLWLHICPLLA